MIAPSPAPPNGSAGIGTLSGGAVGFALFDDGGEAFRRFGLTAHTRKRLANSSTEPGLDSVTVASPQPASHATERVSVAGPTSVLEARYVFGQSKRSK